MEKAQKALLELDPDVICLQEIRDWQVAEELFSVMPEIRIAVVSAFSGGHNRSSLLNLHRIQLGQQCGRRPGKAN